jgi:hypothetical protein
MTQSLLATTAATYENRFIAYVDILGFENLVNQSEETSDPTLESLLDLTRKLGSSEDNVRYAQSGLRVTQVSDCVVVSSEVSPAGVINLLQHCFETSINLLMVGRLCRGYATRGNIFHADRQFMGSGYMKAYRSTEKSGGAPFIKIDQSVCAYIAGQGAGEVSKMFGRLTESDGGDTVISPFLAFKRLPSMLIDGNFDPAKAKHNVQLVREQTQKLVAQLDREEVNALEIVRIKIAHYKRKLAEVLAVKGKEDDFLAKYETAPGNTLS